MVLNSYKTRIYIVKGGIIMEDKIQVTIKGEEYIKNAIYPKGTTYLEISRDCQEQFPFDIILACVNNKLQELNKKVEEDCEIEFLTTKDSSGHRTYCRGMVFVMLKAAYGVIGQDKLKKVSIQYSIGDGRYCQLEGDVELNQELLDKITTRMQEIVDEDITIRKYNISTEEAKNIFEYYHMLDKKRLFEYRRVSKANVYDLDGFKDYFYGYMPPSTGMLKYFSLQLCEGGFIIQMPNKIEPNVIKPWTNRPKLFQTLLESKQWGKTMEVDTVGALNDVISSGGIQDLILVQEAFQEKKIAEIAQQIADSRDKKFVMIAGPSSSGKTTFSHRLSVQLRTHGLKPHPIALDDYFVNRENTPKDEDGKYNFECLEAIDIEKFNKDMTDLLEGKKVELPTFNFKIGQREYRGNYKTLGKDDILVIEGIHGLNDKLSYTLPRESKFKIYISALTQLNIDEHNRIPTTDGRLIRRMVRDARTRGTSAKDTIAMWSSVRRGEESYIFPFQEEADVMYNSASIYELAVLKQFAEPILFGIPKHCSEYIEAKRILKFLDYFIGVGTEDIPKNSIVREFVGGSIFNV